MKGDKQNGEHPEHQAPDASESSSQTKGKARKDSGREEVSSETLEDRGTESKNKKEGVPVSEAQVKCFKKPKLSLQTVDKQTSECLKMFPSVVHIQ